MIALPRFVDPNLEPKDREEQMRERSVARAQSVAAMSTRDASVFQSKGWDALFQAAQDLNSLKTVLEEEEPAVTQPSSDSIRVDESTKKATKQAKAPKRRTHVSHFYSLLDETPEETKAREKRMRERRETLLALHTEERKKWMSSRGRVVAFSFPHEVMDPLQTAGEWGREAALSALFLKGETGLWRRW